MARSVDWDGTNTVTSGSTTYDVVSDVYTLTPDAPFEAGLVTSSTSYSLSYDFTFSFDSYFGDDDAGADGITWLMHADPAGSAVTPGPGGEFLGTQNIQNAWVLEYDTYQNTGEVSYDHIQLRGQSDAGGSFDPAYRATPELALDAANVEDGLWHTNTYTWTAATQTLTVTFDGVTLGQVVFDVGDANGDGFSANDLDTVLGGSDRVFFTFGGSTGGASNEQAVRDIQMTGTICFVRGTRILTPKGEVPVQRLEVGDLVETRDHGPQVIRWIGATRALAKGTLAPIRFAPGTIGNHAPLLVSPQHRMLVTGWQAELLMGEPECLVPALGLVNDRSVRPVADGRAVEYWHILFDAHEVIFANGAPAESLLLGDIALATLSQAYRDEITRLFPRLAQQGPHSVRPLVPQALARAFALPHPRRLPRAG